MKDDHIEIVLGKDVQALLIVNVHTCIEKIGTMKIIMPAATGVEIDTGLFMILRLVFLCTYHLHIPKRSKRLANSNLQL